MNELSSSARFLWWIGAVALTLGLIGSFKVLTTHMAEAAVEVQQHPMSYGKFSRLLWSHKHKVKPEDLFQGR